MLSGASPARGTGALAKGLTTVGLVIAYTKSGDGLEVTKGQTGFAVASTLTSGVAALTFPKHFSFLAGYGGSTEGRFLVVDDINLAAGTASINVVTTAGGAVAEPAADDVFYLALSCGE